MTQTEAAREDTAPTVAPVHISRQLAAPPEIIWRAFTDPNALTSWFWPARLAPRVTAEARVGGSFHIASALARSMAAAISGEYLEVTPPETLVFSWSWEGGESTSRVSVRLAGTAEGTDLTVEHDEFTNEEDRDAQARTWRGCLDRLPDWLALAAGRPDST